MSEAPFMPKATAVWLVENTTLSFKQIANFCNLHELEVKGIADGDVAKGIKAYNPILAGQLTREEIDLSSKDEGRPLILTKKTQEVVVSKERKKAKYTPLSKRKDRPDSVLWMVKNFSQLSDGQIAKLVGSTKATVGLIRNRTYWNLSNLTAKDPVILGLCSQLQFEKAVGKADRRVKRLKKLKEKELKMQEKKEEVKEEVKKVEEEKKKLQMKTTKETTVGIIMGSKSDWKGVMEHCSEVFKEFGINHDARVISAHRTPKRLEKFIEEAEKKNYEVIIAAAGGAAHLAGVTAALTTIPVLGVPMPSVTNGVDSLYSTVQMPAGVPVATLAIGKAGAKNSALFAIAILSRKYPKIKEKLKKFRSDFESNIPKRPY